MLPANSSRSRVCNLATFLHGSRLIANRRWLAILHLCATLLMILSTNRNVSAQVRSEAAAPAQLTIDATQIVSPVSPMLYGLMTEEINHSYEGGLYAEMVQNRTFHSTWEKAAPWDLVRHGDAVASRSIDKSTGPSEALPYSMKLSVASASAGNAAGLTNPGFWGIALRPKTTYVGSFYARVDSPEVGPMTVRLVSDHTGAVQAQATTDLKAGPWARYEYKLVTGEIATSSANHIEFTVAHPGNVWLQLVSLMQPTFHNRPNGNRADLMERMAAMHPHFLRLPGGNYLEGDTLEDWYNWKKTIGPPVDRPGHQSPWSYWSTDGLGLLEFLEWCEDLKIEPVLAVYAGYALKGARVAPGKDLEPYVQSALDEVEYVTGDATTQWGAVRARDGHPAPFPLHYIEIGNEDEFDKSGSYGARFAQFAAALRNRYPQYKLIATDPSGDTETTVHPDVLDEHYYKTPSDMLDLAHHYDTVARTGPKVFVGEWATRSGTPTPNFGDALGDAAWMTSLERNSDLIVMASYAPLLVNISPGAMQWATDLIGFDAQKTYASPSYSAQCLFAEHLGDGTPRSTISGESKRFFYSATLTSGDKVLHLKLVNASNVEQSLSVHLTGVNGARNARMTKLHAASYQATNSMTDPDAIHPEDSTVSVPNGVWQHTVPGLTIEVIDVPLH